jgi:hypothetical protein
MAVMVRPEGREELLRRMVGATIVRIGGKGEQGIEGGGLFIDYLPAGEIRDAQSGIRIQ